jgi:hypothetical protein
MQTQLNVYILYIHKMWKLSYHWCRSSKSLIPQDMKIKIYSINNSFFDEFLQNKLQECTHKENTG